MNLGHFGALQQICVRRDTIVWRGQRSPDGLPVVIKSVTHSASDAQARLRYEWSVLSRLSAAGQQPHIVTPVQLDSADNRLFLAMLDIGASSLDSVQAARRLAVPEIMRIADGICCGLEHVHRQGLMHRDINPSNIIYRESTGQVQLIDFGIAGEIGCEGKASADTGLLEGTLPYASPEQTGRLNRLQDARTDLYSLGVLLYELLYGRRPFTAVDQQELTYQIVATRPSFDLTAAVPSCLREVVACLLAKEPDERYQTAAALRSDLARCAAEMLPGAAEQNFVPQRQGRRERFAIKQKLYGRSNELTALLEAFTAARAGQRQVVFIRGPAGIGKSSLVEELRTLASEADLLISAGKFEMLQRSQPLAVWRQALSAIARALLLEDAAHRQAWERHLRQAAGHVGQVLVDIVPLLGTLLGEQSAVPELPARETENRLMSVTLRVLGAVSQRKILVLFLDDLQWADSATLRLIHALVTEGPTAQRLLLIGAYRDHEVPADHPLALLLADLQGKTAGMHSIAVGPLHTGDVQQMLEDACEGHLVDPSALARFAAEERTDGNPMFVREFLLYLADKGLLVYDAESQKWACDLPQARSAAVPDNMAAILQSKLAALSEPHKALLASAALAGSRFSLHDLIDEQTSHAEAWLAMRDATRLGIVAPLEADHKYAESTGQNVSYQFLHDRLQQAAIGLLDVHALLEQNLRLGLVRLGRYESSPSREGLFAALGPLGAAASLFIERNPARRDGFIALHVEGASQAKRASAFKVALEYLATARSLLGEQAWSSQASTMHALVLEQVDCEYSLGNLQAALAHLEEASKHAIGVLELGRVGQLHVAVLTAASRFDEAIERGIATLKKLQLVIPRHPTKLQTAMAAVRLMPQLSRIQPAALVERPAMANARIHAALDVLLAMGAPAFYGDAQLYLYLVLVGLPLNFKHGNTEASGWVFVTAGMFLSALNRFTQAISFTRAGRRFEKAREAPRYLPVINFSALAFVDFIDMPWSEFLERLQSSYVLAVNGGDRIYAAWASARVPAAAMMMSLANAVKLARHYAAFTAGTALEQQAMSLRGVQFFCYRLRGWPEPETADEPTRSGEAAYRRDVAALGGTGFAQECIFACICGCVEDDYVAAATAVRVAMERNVFRVMSSAFTLHFSLWGLLVHAAAQRDDVAAAFLERRTLSAMRAKVLGIAAGGDAHYGWLRSFLGLMDASAAKNIEGVLKAADSVLPRLEQGSLWGLHAALHEHMGRLLQRHGMVQVAQHSLDLAYRSYGRWGAFAKQWRMQPRVSPAVAPQDDTARSNALSLTTTHTTHTSSRPQAVVLAQWVAALAEAPDQATLLQQAATALRQTSGATHGWLTLDHLSAPLALGKDGADTLGPVDLMQMVIRTGVTHPDPAAAPEHMYSNEAYFATHRPQSLVCLPVRLSGHIAGSLYLENAEVARPFDTDVATMLASCVALASRSLQLQEQVDNEVKRRIEGERAAQQANLSADRANLESQMAGGFAHEMRNALSGAGYILSVMARVPGFPNTKVTPVTEEFAAILQQLQVSPEIMSALQTHAEQLQSFADVLAESVGRGLSITQQILDYAQTSTLIPGDVDCSLTAVVNDVLSAMQRDLQKQNVSFTIHETADDRAYVSAEHASVILRNLITNAVDAMANNPENTPRQLDIAIQGTEASTMNLVVSDSGPGIAPEVEKRLFQPFFSTKGHAGTGLNLALSRKIAGIYGGTLDYEKAPVQGASFTLTLKKREKKGSGFFT